jgi:hypothetical protein
MSQEIEVKVAVTIQDGDLTVKKGYTNSDLDRLLKLPLNKKVKAIRILRKYNIEESERRKEWKKTQRECKELSDDEFYGMLK